jgi:hypothetical protein
LPEKVPPGAAKSLIPGFSTLFFDFIGYHRAQLFPVRDHTTPRRPECSPHEVKNMFEKGILE